MIKKIPSFIDLHSHFRQPGFEYKETIETGIKSAVSGGYSGVCTMANTKPVCDNAEIVHYIINEASKFNFKIYPVAAVTMNLDSNELVNFKELKKAGAAAFSNDGLPILNKEVFLCALKSEELILSHCEDETTEVEWQIEQYKKAILEGYNPKLHFCHISKKSSLDLIRQAKKDGFKITAETAPHYFTFTKNDIDSKNGIFKMNPPLADEEDKKAVIEAVIDGTIDAIATDHAPHSEQEKMLPYNLALNGITGLQTAFSLTYQTFGLDLTIEKLALAPRRILGIEDSSTIKVDLDEIWVVDSSKFQSKCKVSPYNGLKLKGKVINE